MQFIVGVLLSLLYLLSSGCHSQPNSSKDYPVPIQCVGSDPGYSWILNGIVPTLFFLSMCVAQGLTG